MEVGSVRSACDGICRIAARTAKGQIAIIVELAGKKGATVRGAVGCNVRHLNGESSIPGLHRDERPIVLFDNLSTESWFRGHPLHAVEQFAASMVAIAIDIGGGANDAALIVLDPQKVSVRDTATTVLFSELSRIAGVILSNDNGSDDQHPAPSARPGLIADCDALGFQETGNHLGAQSQSGQDPMMDFLLRTLVKKRSLRTRKATHFIALRSWKKSVRDTQIAALRSVKSQLSAAAIGVMSDEIVEAVRQLYAGMKFAAVVPVPCGSSGSDRCLSLALAEAVAKRLGVRYCAALISSAEPGSSHPRKSARLADFQVKEKITGQVLLVDDVATTGTHIELATKALRAGGASPLAIAWIGA